MSEINMEKKKHGWKCGPLYKGPYIHPTICCQACMERCTSVSLVFSLCASRRHCGIALMSYIIYIQAPLCPQCGSHVNVLKK